MTVDVGTVAIVRFPHDTGGGVVAVALIRAYRGDLVLVSKRAGRRQWARARWVPAADIAREASRRESTLGMAVDPLPPRVAA